MQTQTLNQPMMQSTDREIDQSLTTADDIARAREKLAKLEGVEDEIRQLRIALANTAQIVERASGMKLLPEHAIATVRKSKTGDEPRKFSNEDIRNKIDQTQNLAKRIVDNLQQLASAEVSEANTDKGTGSK